MDSAISTTVASETRSHSPYVTISNDVIRIINTIVCGILVQIINLFGIGTNIINIICFVKQGFKDSVNVSLLALTVSDFASLVTMIWSSICSIHYFQDADLPFDPVDMQYLTTGIPHILFTRATCCITALITFERCLCVLMPLKIGQLMTPTKATSIIVCFYSVLIVSVIPIYLSGSYAATNSPERNRTVVAIVFTDKREQMEQISFTIFNVLIPFTAFLIIIITMIIMVATLHKQAKWRTLCSSATNKDTTSMRDQKLTKMIISISVLFVACFTPSVMVFTTVLLVPEFSYFGAYESLLIMSYSLSIFFESTNSSMNIFIYYSMSSRYRAIFRQTFGKRSSKNQ